MRAGTDAGRAGAEREGYVAPRGPAEELLAAVWAEVLGVERVGAGAAFFALGGHSLLAVRVLARMRDLFGVELPVRQIFEEPTVGRLAARIEAACREGVGAPPPIVRSERPEALPLSHAQRRLWFLQRLAPDGFFFNVSHGLRLDGPDWWLHVRPSNTEPVVRVIAEAPTAERAHDLCEQASEMLG